MTKVIKEEFEKIESPKIGDEVEIFRLANIPCDLNEEDDSKQQMTHGSGDDMSMIRLILNLLNGDDEVELIDKESSDPDDEDEVAKIFRIDINVFDFKTSMYVPWVHERPWTDNGAWEEPTLVKNHFEPFNYKNGCLKWPTCSWKDDGYCNEGNLPGVYIVGNTLQDLEWYEALKDGKLKDEALKNKAIMEGMIDGDDESHNNGWKRWDNLENTNRD
nr:hypothetical protein [Tanacetum cinerariifolium]GFA53137.1 hypothetical protein [Tanacetum cinerariifolium]